jgi:hypothetical protein
MISAKVLSTPFLLWHIPFIALLPIPFQKKWPYMLISLMMIAASMTSVPDVSFGFITLHVIIGWVRVVGFSWILVKSIQILKSLS